MKTHLKDHVIVTNTNGSLRNYNLDLESTMNSELMQHTVPSGMEAINMINNCTDSSGNITDGCGRTIPYEEQPYYLQSKNLILYGAPVLVILGTIGNFLSILVMTRKALRSHTTSLYLVVLAVVDTLLLYIGMFYYWIQVLSGVRAELISSYECNKTRIFLLYALPQIESWILCSIVVERLVAVYLPFKVKVIFTKKFAAIQLTITGLIIAAVNAHIFWTSNRVEFGCDADSDAFDTFWSSIWPWIDFCLVALIPFILMLTIDAAIIGKMVYVNRRRRNNLNASSDVKMTGMTTILLTVTFVFFATSMPLYIFLATEEHWEDQADSVEDDARLGLVLNTVFFVSHISCTINFWLYCISARRFREEFLKMIHLKKLWWSSADVLAENRGSINNTSTEVTE